jgi:hypothetical protein
LLSLGAGVLPAACAQDKPVPPVEATPASVVVLPLFSETERVGVVTYWNQPGRYAVGMRVGEKDGPLLVRLQPEGSVWLRAYNNASRPGSQGSTEKRATPLTDTETSKRWEAWVRAKLEYDRWFAQKTADAANSKLGASAAATPAADVAPPLPGVIPPDLYAAVGNPPPFYAAVLPRTYTVSFDDGQAITYSDNIALGNSRNPSYRFAQGVRSFGLRLRDWQPRELDELFSQAGLMPFEQKVMKAVSVLEGGFDSINTYDTGFVSVGFIQFASLGDGAGSLGAVLKQEKETRPAEFERDFRRFGIDVDAQGTMVVLDPQTGAEVRGAQANRMIIDDKRLIAVFERAGRTRAFQTAQIQVAKRNYYPADDPVTVVVDGKEVVLKVSDLIRSEAGMATLFDRKVNTGKIDLLGTVVSNFLSERRLTRWEQVLPYERELIPRLRWRTDFLFDPSLAAPQKRQASSAKTR